jgi:two-component system sensor histidine kinase KdpD
MPIRLPESGSVLAEYALSAAILGAVAAGCLALRDRLATVDAAMLLLLAVVLVASRYRRGPAVFASLLSIAAFDFLFVPPYYTFAVHDTAYLLTFVVMLLVALAMSRLTGVIREFALEAETGERRSRAVAALTADLAGKGTSGEVAESVGGHVAGVVDGLVQVLTPDELDLLEPSATRLVARTAYQEGRAAGPGTGRCEDADVLVAPLRTANRRLGVLAVRLEHPERAPSADQVRTLEALADQASLALERALLAERHERARTEAEAERLRTALLSSLSHDLRTPLATIEGAASGLLEEHSGLTAAGRAELADTILQESQRMNRLVSNLLNMVRVETGALAVTRAWQPLEETLGVALLRVEGKLGRREVAVNLPPDLPLVPIDEILIEQVFVNLLENAAKYTPETSTVGVSAARRDGEVLVEVADRGPGIPPGEEEAVFRKFYRGDSATRGAEPGGSGLGLTIARGIVTAHGGRMWVEHRPGGGAAFRFTLPLSGPQIAEPAILAEPSDSHG